MKWWSAPRTPAEARIDIIDTGPCAGAHRPSLRSLFPPRSVSERGSGSLRRRRRRAVEWTSRLGQGVPFPSFSADRSLRMRLLSIDEVHRPRDQARFVKEPHYEVETFLDGGSGLQRLNPGFDLILWWSAPAAMSGLDQREGPDSHHRSPFVDSAIDPGQHLHYVTKPVKMADLRLTAL